MGVKSELERVLTPSSWTADTERCFALCSSKDSYTVLYFGAEAEQETVAEDEKPQHYTYFLAPAEQSALPPSRKSAVWVSKPCRGSGNLRRQVLTQLITELVTRGKRFCPHLAQNAEADTEADAEEELRGDCDEEMVEAALVWRALWACACESGVEKGTLFLDGLGRRLDAVPGASVVRVLGWVGAETDDETALLRSIGYLATKWLCLRSLATAGVAVSVPGKRQPAPAVAAETHVHAYSGAVMPWLWRLRMFAPLLACRRLSLSEDKPRTGGAEEAVAQYVVSHQQVELTLQLVTAVKVGPESVDVQFSLDNLRCHVARLAAGAPPAHRHVPSRIAVALWPANLKPRDVICVSLSKSSGGAGGGGGWRMRQRRQGGQAAFEWTLYDTAGTEVWCHGAVGDRRDVGRRNVATAVAGPSSAEVVLTDDDFWHAIVWRLGRHVIWKVRVTVVATYVAPTAAAESRCVEVGQDVCMPLVTTKMTSSSSSSSSTIPLRFL